MSQPLLLRMNEAAQLCAVSKAKLYKMVHEGCIPAVKFGKSLRIPYESLRKAIEQNLCGVPDRASEPPASVGTDSRAARK